MKPPKGVPRDEWMLAIGLARFERSEDATKEHDIATAITGVLYRPQSVRDQEPIAAAAYSGADDEFWQKLITLHGGHLPSTYGDYNQPSAYAAGAALAMALEES